MRIAIMPGHYGKDPGAINSEVGVYAVESAITMPIALHVNEVLNKLGCETVFAYGQFDERVTATKGCICGVEIHCDSLPSNTNVSGYHCIHYPGSVNGKRLATSIDVALSSVSMCARKPHGQNLAMLRRPLFPSVIVECGFLTSLYDKVNLLDPNYQYKLALAITEGIVHYVRGR